MQVQNKPNQETELPFTQGWCPTPVHGQVSQIQGQCIFNSSVTTSSASHYYLLFFGEKFVGYFSEGESIKKTIGSNLIGNNKIIC